MKKLLLLSYNYRNQIKCGADQRFYFLLKELKSSFNVTWIAGSPTKIVNIDLFKTHEQDSIELIPAFYKNINFVIEIILKKFFGFIGPTDFYTFRAMNVLIKTIRTNVKDEEYDFILLYYLAHNSFIKKLKRLFPKTKIFIDTCDIQFLRYQKLYLLKSKIYYLAKAIYLFNYKISEINALKKVDLAIMVSQNESNILEYKYGISKSKLYFCPTGTQIMKSNLYLESNPKDYIAFYGALNSISNERAAIFLKRKIFPELKSKFPNLKLLLIGSDPTNNILSLADQDTIVTGFVKDVKKVLCMCKLFLLPLEIDYGHRVRLYEVAALGIPSIVSAESILGMDIECEGIIIANSANDYIEIATKILSDDKYRFEISNIIYEYSKANFSATNYFKNLVDKMLSLDNRLLNKN